MNLVIRDDNLYVRLHDHFQMICPLKKRLKEMTEIAQELADRGMAFNGQGAAWKESIARLSKLSPAPSAKPSHL